MVSPGIFIRIPQKLLEHIQQEARTNHDTIPGLVRKVFSHRYAVQKSRQQTLAYGFAGVARRQIREYVDNFAGPPGSAVRKRHVK